MVSRDGVEVAVDEVVLFTAGCGVVGDFKLAAGDEVVTVGRLLGVVGQTECASSGDAA